MFSDRIFQIAILISIITHGVILFQNSNLQLFTQVIKKSEVEVKYVKTPREKKEEQARKPLKREPLLKLPLKITADNKIPPPFIDKENIFKVNRSNPAKDSTFSKPAFIKPDIIAIKKKITLPPLNINMDKINNPIYISYYQIVREKIKRTAYQIYTGREVGEVTISFIISGDGTLKDLRIIEEKSSPSPYLRETALRSVKDASSFPVFPKELDYPQLSFNLVITFEVE